MLGGPLLVVGIACGALTLLAIAANIADHDFSHRLATLLAYYDDATRQLAEFLRLPIVASAIKWALESLRDGICSYGSYLAFVCDIKLELDKDWILILQILSLYFANSWKNNYRHRRWNAWALVVPYAALAVFGAVGFGLFVKGAPAIAALFPTVMLVLSETVEAVATSHFYPYNNQTFQQTFSYYMKETVRPRLLIFGVVNAVGAVAILVLPAFVNAPSESGLGSPSVHPIALGLPIAFVLAIALWLLYRAYLVAMKDAPVAERSRYFRTRHSTRLAITILSVFALALGAYVFDEFVVKPYEIL